jgi:Transglutaminase-like superfamily
MYPMPDKLANLPENIGGTQTADQTQHPHVTLQELKVLLSQYWFAVRLGVWLCWLPILLRVHTLPALLQRLTPVRGRQQSRSPPEMDRAVRMVVRLCQLRLFRGPMFPRPCLRQALALYYVLIRMGYPVEIHFGVYKEGEDLCGHSWVTVQGMPVAERMLGEACKVIYSFPSASYRAPPHK